MNRIDLSLRTPPARPVVRPLVSGAHLTSGSVYLLFAMMILGPAMSIKDVAASGEGSPLRQAIYLLIFGIVAGSAWWRRPRALLAVPVNIMLVVGWCWLSLSWSIAPGTGLRRLILTSLLIWTVFIATRELGYRRTVSTLRIMMIVTLFVNFAAVFLVPKVGVHLAIAEDGDPALVGAWRGVMLQKNFAGAMCGFTVLFFAFDGKGSSVMLRLGVILGSLMFLWGTKSKTSAGLLLLSLAIGWLFMRYNPRYRSLVLPATMVLAVAMILAGVIYWSDIIAPLYEPEAFTGRTQIWPPLLNYARDHWLGSGYGSFWNIGPGASPIFLYAKGWVAHLGNGHNGYLDLLVQIGLPGMILAMVCLILWPIGRLLMSVTVPRAQGALLIGVIIFLGGHNFTESSMLDRDMLGQIVLMFTLALTWMVTDPRRALPAPTAARGAGAMAGVNSNSDPSDLPYRSPRPDRLV